MKILLAVDGSPYSKKMLAYLVTHSSLFDAGHEYTVFTAQSAVPPRARAAVGKEIVEKYYADEAEKVLAPVDSAVANLVMGSVATQVLAHCKVPVLMVR